MEEKDQEKQENLFERCNVFGSDDVLTDDADIAYYKACIEEFSAANRLLGDIMHDGHYVISQEVKFDLVKLPKEIVAENENTIEATARLLAKDMFFSIEIEEEEENLVASLYLTEVVSGFLNIKSIKSFIARIKQPKTDDFFDKTKRVFNLQKVVDAISEGAHINLATRIQDQIDYSLRLDDIDELASQIYLLKMLELLENSGEKGKTVVDTFKREVKIRKLDKPSVKFQHKKMRKLLDEVIKQAGGEKVVLLDKQKEARQIKQEYATSIQRIEHTKGKFVIRETEKNAPAAKKQEEKSSGNDKKKSESKKSSAKSGGGKKKAKKAGKSAEKSAGKSAGKSSGGGGRAAGKILNAEPRIKKESQKIPVPPAKTPAITLVPRARKPLEKNRLSREIDLLDGSLAKEKVPDLDDEVLTESDQVEINSDQVEINNGKIDVMISEENFDINFEAQKIINQLAPQKQAANQPNEAEIS